MIFKFYERRLKSRQLRPQQVRFKSKKGENYKIDVV
jgi:hypothetical protein